MKHEIAIGSNFDLEAGLFIAVAVALILLSAIIERYQAKRGEKKMLQEIENIKI